MEPSKIDQLQNLLDDLRRPQEAATAADSIERRYEVRSLVIDLTTARLRTDPLRIGFPFRGVVAVDATDNTSNINLIVSTRDTYQDAIPFRKNADLKLPFSVSEGYLYWSAQSGKSITLLFFVSGEFSTNAINLQQSGGVSISEGTTVSDPTLATVTTSAAQLFAASASRIKTMIMNYGGNSIFIGGSTTLTDDTGATPGIEIAPGGSYSWESTAACYAIAKGGSNTAISYITFS